MTARSGRSQGWEQGVEEVGQQEPESELDA